MKKSEWNRELLFIYKATIEIFENIANKTIFKYKKLKTIELFDYKDYPTWCDGHIEIGYNNDPQSLAHELAHGLHEKIREANHDNKYGEEFSDAIRYFVEEKILPESTWSKSNKNNPILIECNSNLQNFIEKLNSKDFFNNIGWP